VLLLVMLLQNTPFSHAFCNPWRMGNVNQSIGGSILIRSDEGKLIQRKISYRSRANSCNIMQSSSNDIGDDNDLLNDKNDCNHNSPVSKCPLSMTFSRYRIDLSSGKDDPSGPGSGLRSGASLFSGLKASIDRSTLERKYGKQLVWIDDELEKRLHRDRDKNSKRQLKAEIGVHVSAIFWRAVSDLADCNAKKGSDMTRIHDEHEDDSTLVLAFPDASHMCLRRLVDIVNWLEEQTLQAERRQDVTAKRIVDNYPSFSSDHPMSLDGDVPILANGWCAIHAKIDEDAPVSTVILARSKVKSLTTSNCNSNINLPTAETTEARTKAWVDRVLVKMGICPFTKSTTKSGQGLNDVGVPVGRIAYHYSKASTGQISSLMADTWEAISDMITAGPSGKKGISSILLAAPQYDTNFSLWAGPIFATLEATVCAAAAEPIVGVVCFHPNYATPDGNSWPGFGHMHSVPRLRKWIQEEDEEFSSTLTDEEVAAGGAFQRRTPHATINVLRAEQLEAAENRRITGNLYCTNIRTFSQVGFRNLNGDLEKERNLICP